MRKTSKVTFERAENTLVVDSNTGEVRQESRKTTKEMFYESEPPYVKLYLDCLCKFKDMQTSLNPILVGFLEKSTYAGEKAKNGGQIIYCTKYMKEEIAESCKVSLKRVEQALTEFVKKNIFSRIAVGTYQVNPYLFGKGDWKDIRNVRATFDFGTGEINADIVKDEEQELNDATDTIASKYTERLTKAMENTT